MATFHARQSTFLSYSVIRRRCPKPKPSPRERKRLGSCDGGCNRMWVYGRTSRSAGLLQQRAHSFQLAWIRLG